MLGSRSCNELAIVLYYSRCAGYNCERAPRKFIRRMRVRVRAPGLMVYTSALPSGRPRFFVRERDERSLTRIGYRYLEADRDRCETTSPPFLILELIADTLEIMRSYRSPAKIDSPMKINAARD